MQQSQISLVEFLEPIIPTDMLQRIFAAEAWEIEAEHSDITLGASSLYTGRLCAAFFSPASNFFVVGRDLGFCSGSHGISLLK
ncbi:MAG TPA: hypothetical protein VKU02_03150 [Gemmataceae bacterium]|nr:hypothetical protein [Gemmataceae bacterium]